VATWPRIRNAGRDDNDIAGSPGLEEMVVHLTKSAFAENLNTKFWLRDPAGERVAIDLVELNDSRSSPQNEAFSLLFRGDSRQVYPQRLYSVEHDTMGAFDLFLVPVGRDEKGTFYEAVFNRLL